MLLRDLCLLTPKDLLYAENCIEFILL